MVHVEVKIFSQAIPNKTQFELGDGSSVENLLEQIRERISRGNPEVSSDKIAFFNNKGSLVVLINGISIYALTGWKTLLQERDEVSILPMVAGG